ncbi:MAG: type II toxin-antitoxin system VapC family toxin [Pirellulales bacterium]|nr:type II toxin-antitoxin system VapC family toxin [Pirellulales bacterium]
MTATMVDSCVLLDILTEDPAWFEWSSRAIDGAIETGRLIINPIIYAEISIGYERIEELESVLPKNIMDFRPITREAAFLAGKCFLEYRQRGGIRTSPLPDFFIGAHASVENIPLITRDTTHFRSYFPNVELIHP